MRFTNSYLKLKHSLAKIVNQGFSVQKKAMVVRPIIKLNNISPHIHIWKDNTIINQYVLVPLPFFKCTYSRVLYFLFSFFHLFRLKNMVTIFLMLLVERICELLLFLIIAIAGMGVEGKSRLIRTFKGFQWSRKGRMRERGREIKQKKRKKKSW